MTGTSLDGLDAVLTRIDGEGLGMTATFVRMVSRSFDDELRRTLRSLASAESHRAEDFVRAARALGELHAEVVGELMHASPPLPLPRLGEGRGEGMRRDASAARSTTDDHKPSPPAPLPGGEGREPVGFIVAHGQTIFHAGDERLSWQLFDPWPIVRKLGLPVCYDLRQADLAAGGQGAPITPIADWIIYRRHADHVVNLGGIVNVTDLDADLAHVGGGDIGPCNLLIDGLCERLCGEPIDRDGGISAQGKDFTDAMVWIADAITAAHAVRSLGREQFNPTWLDKLAAMLRQRGVSGPDALRGAVEAVANTIASHTAAGRDDRPIVLAGGGTNNRTLVAAIRQRQREKVMLCDDLDIPCAAREAMAFAVLGALSQDKVPITLPRVTGARSPGIAGAWAYP